MTKSEQVSPGGTAGPEEDPLLRAEPRAFRQPFRRARFRARRGPRPRGRRHGLPARRRHPPFRPPAGRRRGARGPAPRLLQRRRPRPEDDVRPVHPARGALREDDAAPRPDGRRARRRAPLRLPSDPRPDLRARLGPGGRPHSPARQPRYRSRPAGPLGLLPRLQLPPAAGPGRLRPARRRRARPDDDRRQEGVAGALRLRRRHHGPLLRDGRAEVPRRLPAARRPERLRHVLRDQRRGGPLRDPRQRLFHGRVHGRDRGPRRASGYRKSTSRS